MSYPQPPYGQEPYGHPMPPPVYSAAPPPGYPPASPPTNRTAIVALIFSLLIAPVGLILGYVARGQIRRSHEDGAGLAKAAIIIGWIWTLASIAIIVALIASGVVVITGARTDTNSPGASSPGTKSNDPEPGAHKQVTYEIWGSGSHADINYLDLDAQPQHVDDAALPWTLTLDSADLSVYLNITAQGDGDSISCRITVGDKVEDERTTDGAHAQTFCLMKSN